MATIDLIVLGMLKQGPLSAYDIQKKVEYRNISQWVKISTPSIYKKVIQLEKKGLMKAVIVKEGKMPEKAIYSLTEAGEREFEALMMGISSEPIRIFLDFNAVVVNLGSLSPEAQRQCMRSIETNVEKLRLHLEQNLSAKDGQPEIPELGIMVLQQQLMLVEAIETWVQAVLRRCL